MQDTVAIDAGALQTLFDLADLDLLSDAFDSPSDEQHVKRAVETAERALNGENDAVAISTRTAEVSLRELNILIEETQDPDDGGDDHRAPLARVKSRLQDNVEGAFTPGAEAAYNAAIQIVDDVGEETGAETAEVDPLQSDVFEARDELAETTDLGRDYP